MARRPHIMRRSIPKPRRTFNPRGHLASGAVMNNLLIPRITETAFVTTWDTENLGGTGSATKVILLPMTAGVEVDWGDGTVNNLNTHTYATGGIKTVKIEGAVTGFKFNNGGDKLKLTDVSNVGGLVIDDSFIFYNCSNMTWSATDAPSVTSSLPVWTFRGCTNFNGNVDNWDMSAVTNIDSMFRDCTSFNQPLNSWDVSNVATMTHVFRGSAFNHPLSNWDTSSVFTMQTMFFGSAAFDQDVSDWDFGEVTNATSMFLSSGFTQTNYDPLLISLDAQTLQSGVSFSAGTAKFGAGAPATARANLVGAPDLWVITDGGAA